MRKRLKLKRRSCPMCKPHKMRGDRRWHVRDLERLERSEREIAEAKRVPSPCQSPSAPNA